MQLEALKGRDARALFLLETQLYDRRLLQERLQYLRRVRQQGNVDEVMFAVRSDLLRNLGNMTNSLLHEHFPVVPDLIREYIQQVQDDLRFITSSPDAPLDERLAFLRESRHAFGRTALVLSGGGSFGAFHMGIVKALLDANLLPRVVSGSSAGSIGGQRCWGAEKQKQVAQPLQTGHSQHGGCADGGEPRSVHHHVELNRDCCMMHLIGVLLCNAVSAIICTRTESEVEDVSASLSSFCSNTQSDRVLLPSLPTHSLCHHLHAHRIRSGRSLCLAAMPCWHH
jgi:hypothetical protein